MLLSISSSERRSARSWLATWALALLACALATVAIERAWRARGYAPTVLDSMQLWSAQRDRVYGTSPRPLALLGASRTEYGVDLATMRRALPHHRPVMLAINGTYPLATLRDLAADADFRGDVLVDIESNGFLREYRDMQQAYVDYYRTRWSPSWRVHRALLTRWQRVALIANPDFGAVATLRRAFAGGEPFRNYVDYHADRSGDVDYAKTDPEAAKRHFAATVDASIARLPKRTPEEWLADIAPVFAWVRAIQARGGRVLFYETPVHGVPREANDRVYPRDRYWDRFAAASPAPTLAARDVPAIDAIALPDDAHLDYRDKAAYTSALVDALVARGWIER